MQFFHPFLTLLIFIFSLKITWETEKRRKTAKEEEQKVKLAAKNLYKKLTEEKQNLFVVDWYKDEQASTTVKDAIISSLDADLPQSFDKEAFDSKINLLLNHFVDMSVQHYGWLGDVA